MSEKLFSVLIPCYNTHTYLNDTIHSIISQEFQDYEIICIDDGSLDNTPEIIKSWKEKYPNRIKAYFNKHQGVSKTRNDLVKYSTGKYLIFLDSDDIMGQDFLRIIAEFCRLKKPDCIIGNYECITIDGKEISKSILNSDSINNRTQEEVLEYLYQDRCVYALCRFIIKRSIIVNSGVKFNEEILHEDEDWVTRMLLKCQTFGNVPNIQFKYRRRPDSITMNPGIHNYWSKLIIAKDLLLESANYSGYKEKHLLRKVYRLCKEMYYTIMENVGDERRD